MTEQRPAAEMPDAEETAEVAAPLGPQPVSASTWLMLAACALVLVMGLVFAWKFRP